MLEIGEMVISAFIGLVGLGPASRVFTFHLLDGVLTTTTTTKIRSEDMTRVRTSPAEFLATITSLLFNNIKY
jgi:hypothetical protein